MLGVLQDVVNRLDLFLHQVAEHLVVREIGSDQSCGGVGPVGCSESVVDVAVRIRGKFFNECLLALFDSLLGGRFLLVSSVLGESSGFSFLLSVVTQVLEHQHLTGLESGGLGVSFLAVIGKLNRNSKFLGNMTDDMFQGEFGVNSLRASEVGHKDKGTTLGKDLLQSGKGGADTGVVCDLEVLVKRNVEIHPDNGLLAFEIVRVNVLLHNV